MICFSNHGYADTSIKMIADNAGLSYQLIPYHFKTKNNLWKIVVKELFDGAKKNALKHFEEIIDSPASHRKAAIRKYLFHLYSSNIHMHYFRSIITHEIIYKSEQYYTLIKPMIKDFVKNYVESLEKLVKLNIIKNFNAEELAMIIPTFAMGNILMRDEYETMSGKKITSRKFIELEVDLVMKMIFPDDK